MSNKKVPMTAAGADQLRKELHELKTVIRPKIIHDIAVARAHGDLKENAEYHAAREEQSFIEAKIRTLEHKLAHAQIIDVSSFANDGKVIFASTVRLVHVKTNAEVTYKIVGDEEANIKEGKISVNSPIARALIGKYEGDVIEVQAPGGVNSYEISVVEYI